MNDRGAAGRLEDVATCGICGSAPAGVRHDFGAFRVVRCAGCGVHWTTPRLHPDDYGNVYSDSYWASERPRERGYRNYLESDAMHRRTYDVRARVLDGLRVPGGRLLDAGCAHGVFLDRMRSEGWDVRGIEYSDSAAATGRERYGLDIRTGDLADLLEGEAAADLVTFWDCIEHLPDPAGVLRRAVRCLSPGGLLLVETQDIDSLFARVAGRRWHHFKHWEHLYHFNRRSLLWLMDHLGLRVERMTRRHAGKFIDVEFLRERSLRVGPWFAGPLGWIGRTWRRPFYVNLFDEWIVIARRD